MARTPKTDAAVSTEAKKPRAPQKRVMHIFYIPKMKDGSPVPDGVEVEIVNVMSDARKVVDYIDSDEFQGKGIKRYKHEVISNPRGDDEDVEVTEEAVGDQSNV